MHKNEENTTSQAPPPTPPEAGATPGKSGPDYYYPPTGTYPSPDAPPVVAELPQTPPPSPGKPRKTRRVGTLTMALALIAIGVVMLLRLVIPSFDLLYALRFAPVLLILLGLELIWANIRYKDEKLRYDILSIFICLLLILGNVAAAVVPEYLYYEIEGGRVSRRLGLELEEASFDALRSETDLPIARIEWYVGLDYGHFSTDMTAADIAPEHYVQLRVHMPGEYTTPAAFVADCRRVIALVEDLAPHVDYASFYGYEDERFAGEVRYTLWLDSRWQFADSATEMEQRVLTEHWLAQEQYYISQEDYEYRMAHPEEYGYDPDTDTSLLAPADSSASLPAGSDVSGVDSPDDSDSSADDFDSSSSLAA